MRTAADLIKDLEQLGEATVRTKFLSGDYRHPETSELVRDWLASKEAVREEARAEESLANSRKALRISIWAIRIAIIAMVLSPVVAIIIAWWQSKW
ncbi:MAG: hypothetical protein ABR865_05545 [Terracidiphilus sp.]|jgi:hypothetical protein